MVPADNKWFTRLVVMGAVVDALQSLGVEYPRVTDEQKKELAIRMNEFLPSPKLAFLIPLGADAVAGELAANNPR